MNEEFEKKFKCLKDDVEDMFKQVEDLSIQLDKTRKEKDFLTSVNEENQSTIRMLTATVNTLNDRIAQKDSELDFKKLLDRLLPVIKKIIENCETLEAEQLEQFKSNNLPQYRKEVSYALEMLGVSLNYHKPGEIVDDIDDTIVVRPNYTADKSLSNQVYKSSVWGYGMIGEDTVILKERVCVWIYDEAMKRDQSKELTTYAQESCKENEGTSTLDEATFPGQNHKEHAVECVAGENDILNSSPYKEAWPKAEETLKDITDTVEALLEENESSNTENVQATEEANVPDDSAPTIYEEKQGELKDAEKKKVDYDSTEKLEIADDSKCRKKKKRDKSLCDKKIKQKTKKEIRKEIKFKKIKGEKTNEGWN